MQQWVCWFGALQPPEPWISKIEYSDNQTNWHTSSQQNSEMKQKVQRRLLVCNLEGILYMEVVFPNWAWPLFFWAFCTHFNFKSSNLSGELLNILTQVQQHPVLTSLANFFPLCLFQTPELLTTCLIVTCMICTAQWMCRIRPPQKKKSLEKKNYLVREKKLS